MTDKRQIWNFIYFIRLPLEEESDTSKIKDPDWELMYRLSLSHNVAALGYAAARIMKDKGSSISEELLRKWKEKSDQSTMQCLYQQAEQEYSGIISLINDEISFRVTGKRSCTGDCSSCGGCKSRGQ